jgi:hypothetical protein
MTVDILPNDEMREFSSLKLVGIVEHGHIQTDPIPGLQHKIRSETFINIIIKATFRYESTPRTVPKNETGHEFWM